MMIRCFYSFLLMFGVFEAIAQDNTAYDTRALKYVSQYYELAIKEQKRTGVPASITLAQGIVETDGGTSELMTKANNHFGIKCKNDWKGETFLHTDDKPNECFKKYKSPEDSYKDHSDHLLRNPRYAPLFKLKVSDYTAWAKGLKECGYATCSTYAEKLIKAIEDYKLQDYTYAALNNTEIKPIVAPPVSDSEEADSETVQPLIAVAKTDSPKTIAATNNLPNNAPSEALKKPTEAAATLMNKPTGSPEKMVTKNENAIVAKPKVVITDSAEDTKYQYGKQITINGLKAFYAHKGESMLPYAVQYNMRYAHLLEINDLPDAPLPGNMLIYTEKKLQSGIKPVHVVKENETLLQIAQLESIQLKRLMAFNMLDEGEEPAVGVQLEMQTQASHKPDLRNINNAPPPENMSLEGLTASTNTATGNYITTNNAQVRDTVMAQTAKQIAPKQETGDASASHTPDHHGNTAGVQATPNQTNTTSAKVDASASQHPRNENATPPKTADADFEYNGTGNASKKPDTQKQDDLAALKADMDKAVYAKDTAIVITTQFPNKTKKADKPIASTGSGSSDKFYKVQQGDTLSGIAKRYHVSLKKLLQWNDINPDALHLGQKIQISE